MSSPQFRLKSLFILTAIVAVGCLVGPPILTEVRIWLEPIPPDSIQLVVDPSLTPQLDDPCAREPKPDFQESFQFFQPAEPPKDDDLVREILAARSFGIVPRKPVERRFPNLFREVWRAYTVRGWR
jgi:hypothetical protein